MARSAPKKRRKLPKSGPSNLNEFSKRNPWSKIQRVRDRVDILRPWNDSSLILSVAKKELGSLHLLNHLVLPERFNAVFHPENKRLEFIFNALFDEKEPPPSEPFEFQFRGRAFSCAYGAPSDELLFLARVHKPIHSSVESSFRNLDNLQNLQQSRNYPRAYRSLWHGQRGLSFYIDGVQEYDEDFVVLLSKHLNFYMSYFERQSPQVQILPVASSEEQVDELPLEKMLPKTINAAELDPFLLDLSSAAREGQVRLRFLYYYQMLEYSAFYWVEEGVKATICKILKAPDLQARVDDYFPKLIEALSPTRQQDEHKIRRVIESRVEPRAVWNEVKQQLAYFTSEHRFDGGFILDPLLSKDSTEDAFVKMWSPKVFDTIRGIRNSLVHARESRTQAVIFPTIANDKTLEPWLPIIRLIAEQVMLFEP